MQQVWKTMNSQELKVIESRTDVSDIPRLVAEVRRLSEIVEVAKCLHEAQRNYQRTTDLQTEYYAEMRDAEKEFISCMNSVSFIEGT